MKTALILPTLNAENTIDQLLNAVLNQTRPPDAILIIDSSSQDKTVALAQSFPVKIITLPQSEFNHGGTRRLGTESLSADIYVFMTQDVLPVNAESFANLIEPLIENEKIGCAYGRQLPHPNADPIAEHARYFNYRAQSHTRTLADKQKFGFKVCFNSDNFAAYRKTALEAVGGFPKNLNFGEDSFVAGKMLLSGWHVHYAADALIYHSHNETTRSLYRRYYQIGQFHQTAAWMKKEFGDVRDEGLRFVTSEIRYLAQKNKWPWIPKAVWFNLVKYWGYRKGLHSNA